MAKTGQPCVTSVINVRVREERATELSILFDTVSNPWMPKDSIKARDVQMGLTKVDDDTLQVEYMGAQVTAKRVK